MPAPSHSIGYNIDMLPTAPTAALTSATNVWSVFYKELFEAALNGEEIAPDWAKGYDDGAVAVTGFGPSCAAGTAEKVAEVEAALRDGSLKVFDTATFTVNGETVTSAPCDMTIMDWATGTVAYQGETYEGIVDGAFANPPSAALRTSPSASTASWRTPSNPHPSLKRKGKPFASPFAVYLLEGVSGSLCKTPLNCAISQRLSAASLPTKTFF